MKPYRIIISILIVIKALFMGFSSAVWMLAGLLVLKSFLVSSTITVDWDIDINFYMNLIFYAYLPIYTIVTSTFDIMDYKYKIKNISEI
jgi:hypothetical protein